MIRRETFQSEGVTISYLRAAGRADGPRLLLLHGSPNEAAYWRRYLEDPPGGCDVVAVDRPGFGQSGPGCAIPSLADQARLIAPLLSRAGGFGTIVAGQSQGGPIACRLAVDQPELVAALALSACPADPRTNTPNWYQRLADRPAIRALLPERWAVSAEEMMALSEELRQLAPRLSEIRCPVHVLQGQSDWLVDPADAEYLRERLTNARWLRVTRIDGARHKLPQDHEPVVRLALENLVDLVETRRPQIAARPLGATPDRALEAEPALPAL